MIPGDLESAPILISESECSFSFDWYTAAACVLSKTEGDNCQVSDPQAGRLSICMLATFKGLEERNCHHLLFLLCKTGVSLVQV